MSNMQMNAVRAAILLLAMATIAIVPLLRTGYAQAPNPSATVLALSDTVSTMTFSVEEKSAIALSGGDLDLNGAIDDYEFDAVRPMFESLLREQLALEIDGERTAWIRTVSFGVVRDGGTPRVVLQTEFPPAEAGATVSFADSLYEGISSSGYANALTIQDGDSSVAVMLSGSRRDWEVRKQ